MIVVEDAAEVEFAWVDGGGLCEAGGGVDG